MNRFIVIFALLGLLLGFCLFISTNVYVNAIMLFLGFCAALVGFAYVFDTMTQKELRFFNKLERIIN